MSNEFFLLMSKLMNLQNFGKSSDGNFLSLELQKMVKLLHKVSKSHLEIQKTYHPRKNQTSMLAWSCRKSQKDQGEEDLA